MRLNTMRRIFHSVFTQLLLICLVAGLLIVLLVTGFFIHVFRKSAQLHLQKNVNQYLTYVAKDLGTPPSLERARVIARESGIQIRFEGPGAGWTTSDSIPTRLELGEAKEPRPRLSRFRLYRKHPIVFRQGKGVFVFMMNPEHAMESGWELWTALLIALLSLVVALTYLAVRHILNPLKSLAEGVQQVSNGNLDYQVPHWRSAEFDQLAEGFNTMTVRIRNMLHAKEQLLLDVSHELRSPLTRMKVALEMVEDSRIKEPLADDVREMETMVSEILDAARLGTATGELHVEAIPAKILLQEMEALYRNQAPGLLVGPVPDAALINGDRMLVKIVLNNIISNAIKYSPADGEPVRLTFRQEAEYSIVEVSDHGLGIPEADLPYIFEPFYRVDKSRSKRTGGYGLGLSLCKTIMAAHQDKIEVASTPGAGTAVSLFFRHLDC